MLALDGMPVNLDSMKAKCSLELKDRYERPVIGTDTAEQGDKGKKLTFSGRIPFTRIDTLTQLYSFASDKDETNTRRVYRIGSDIALALKIRNVKFTCRINAREHETLQAWNVSFELREHNSVAEQKEQRAKEQTKPEQRENTRLKQL